MSPSPKSQLMFVSEFSGICDFVRIFGITSFKRTAHLLNILICMRLADFAHMASQLLGCHCGPARHNSSNIGVVTAGQMGHGPVGTHL